MPQPACCCVKKRYSNFSDLCRLPLRVRYSTVLTPTQKVLFYILQNLQSRTVLRSSTFATRTERRSLDIGGYT